MKVVFLTFFVSINYSTGVNFACWIRLCHSFLNWTKTRIAFRLLTSFQWLFILMLKLVSDLTAFWISHRKHSSSYIIYSVLCKMVWYMLKTIFIWLQLNLLVFTSCIQQQHKPDLVLELVFLLPCYFSGFFLATIPYFFKWPSMRSCIF